MLRPQPPPSSRNRRLTAPAANKPSKMSELLEDDGLLEEEELPDDGEDGFMDLDADEFGEDDEAEDVITALGLGEDDQAPGISTGGTVWGEAGLKAAEKVSIICSYPPLHRMLEALEAI